MVRFSLAALLTFQPFVQAAELAPVEILLTQEVPRDESALATTGPENGERLAKLQSDLTLVAEGLEGFASEEDSEPSLKRLRESVDTPEGFKSRTSALDATYRALAVVDYTWAKRLPEPPCSPEAARARLLKSGELSSWISSLLGPPTPGADTGSQLDQASAAVPASARDYALLRAKIRKVTAALAAERAVGSTRATLYCRRAESYEALSSANRAVSELVAASRANLTDEFAGVYVLARKGPEGLVILGAATSVDSVLLTDGRLADGDDLLVLGSDRKKLIPVRIERRDDSGLALLRAAEPLKGFQLADAAPAKADLIHAIGHPDRTGVWTRTSGLVTAAESSSFQSDAVIDVGMSGGAALNEDGRLAGVFVLRPARAGGRSFDWPIAIPAPALREWLDGRSLKLPSAVVEIEEGGTASVQTASRPLLDSLAPGARATQAGYSFYDGNVHAVCKANCDDGGSSYGSNGGAELGAALGKAMAPLVEALIFKGVPALFRGIGSLFKSKPRPPKATVAEVVHPPSVKIAEPKIVEQPKPNPEFTVTLQPVRLIAGKEAIFSVKVKSNREDVKPAGLHIEFTVDYDKETSTGTAVTDEEGNALLEVRPSAAAVAFNGLDQESDRYSRLITAGRETEAGKVCRMVLPRALVFGMVTAAAVATVVPGGALVAYGVGQGCLAAASGIALGGGVFCANEFVKEAMAPTPQQPAPDYVRSIPKSQTKPKAPADAFDAVRDRARRAVNDVDRVDRDGELSPSIENVQNMAGGQAGDPNEPPDDDPKGEVEDRKPEIDEKSSRHIFRAKEGHLPDTPENRELLVRTAGDKGNYLGRDIHGNRIFARLTADGKQVWVEVRNGMIRNGGLNQIPREFPGLLP